MAITINSCLKPTPAHRPPQTLQSNTNNHKPTLAAPSWGTNSTSLQRKLMTTAAACIVIGSTIGGGDRGSFASAAAEGMQQDAVAVEQPEMIAVGWSDKRNCPPWDNNYLERSVPENLPRPFTRGKNNGHVSSRSSPAPAPAPTGAPLVRYNSSCFSL